MKEYRVVCTLDIKKRNGETFHYENTTPLNQQGFGVRRNRFKTLEEAKEGLTRFQENSEKLDIRSHVYWKANDPNTIWYEHSNFHIQSRTVTDWK